MEENNIPKPKPHKKEQSLVRYIKSLTHISLEEKIRLKSIGRPTPMLNLQIKQLSSRKGTIYSRNFQYSWYDKYPWMCGCPISDRMYCFPCLLFESPALAEGIYNLSHLTSIVQKHVTSKQHISSAVKFAMLPTNNSNDTAMINTTQETIELARKNKQIINKIIDFLKYCWCTDNSIIRQNTCTNPNDLIKTLHKFNQELDPVIVTSFLQTTPVLKNRLHVLYDKLTLSMCKVLQNHIKKEIEDTDYVSLIVEETSEYTDEFYIIIYFRFLDLNLNIQERLWGIEKPESRSARSIAKCLSEVLDSVLSDKQKLISQSYDGGSLLYHKYHEIHRTQFVVKTEKRKREVDPLAVDDTNDENEENTNENNGVKTETQFLDNNTGMKVEELTITDYTIEDMNEPSADIIIIDSNGPSVSQHCEIKKIKNSVADIIRDKYKYCYALCLPCHAHDFSTILSQILCKTDEFRLFFANVNMIFNFFGDFDKKRPVLREALGVFNLENIRWNIKLKISIIFVNLGTFSKSLANLKCFDYQTIYQAHAIEKILEDEQFVRMLKFVNELMNYGETFNEFNYSSFSTDVTQMKSSLLRLYRQYQPFDTSNRKRKRLESFDMDEIFDNMIDQINERCFFNFKPIELTLMDCPPKIPDEVAQIVIDYNEKKFRFELETIKETKEFKELRTTIDMLRFFKQKNIDTILSTVCSVIQILLTKPPMKLSENKSDVFHRVKEFLADSKDYDLKKLPTLALLSVEHNLFGAVANFNDLVIKDLGIW